MIYNYLDRISLSNLTHMKSMNDIMTISMETSKIDNG